MRFLPRLLIGAEVLPVWMMACAASQPSPSEGRLAIATVERDRFCDEDAEHAERSVLRDVRSAEPLYVTERVGKTSYDARLVGARLWLPARPGLTPQWLERTLRCHQARHVLQPDSAQPTVPDPFWLPDGWIEIDVEPERGGFVAVLRADDVAEGQQIYARAQAFVAKPPGQR